ncbi:hypothetical protein LTS14_007432 [Recurvomyces mirabilis]|uniref:uncharacterized protein n=1 Tax=Recurvomyces mirabilis TaxID=574656 RepID=UPI002DE106E4|nr:hypothetical protein LTS14_007432 [Recurvomyces mirabilis]
MSTNLYRYDVLRSQTTFRLLRLHAGQGDKIIGSLHHHTLASENCPPYRAVSYTWGRDAARYDLHLPNNAVIRIRKNLANALRAIRDSDSACWLWVDAICIDQSSDQERNHQVRLMADIYGRANIVVAWLHGANEHVDLARAFAFVHNAVTYGTPTQPVYHYSRKHISRSRKDWQSIKRLCRLRYWTRKWIIQELVNARTVVLRAGSSKCSMQELELFCKELDQEQNSEAYTTLDPARRDICSLVGEHRRHLRIDYGATAVQRLVSVLRFVHDNEQIESARSLSFTRLLTQLFRVTQDDILRERSLYGNLQLAIPALALGTIEYSPESHASEALRARVERLEPSPRFMLDTSAAVWTMFDHVAQVELSEAVAQPDMAYFTIRDTPLHGLAACRLQAGDLITLLPSTELAFVVRRFPNARAAILARAYLFVNARDEDTFDFWQGRLDLTEIETAEQTVSMPWFMLVELGSLATLTRSVWKDHNPKADVSPLQAIWKSPDKQLDGTRSATHGGIAGYCRE